MNPNEAYSKLCARSAQVSYLASAMAVLHWDQRTSIPPKGHGHRANQLAALAQMHHALVTDPVIGDWLAAVEASPATRDPLSVEAVNVREWRRAYDRAVKIPERLAVALAKASAETQSVWEVARPRNDWAALKPYLEQIVRLKREQAEALGYENEPYDALLDLYEPGATAAMLEPIFRTVVDALVDMLHAIQAHAPAKRSSLESLTFPIKEQRRFAESVAMAIGYDMEAGRLDVSAHPFTIGIGPGDVRITTRYRETSFTESFFGVVHETGHALYHQGLPLEHWGTPFCKPVSLGINESQSRMWENIIARSKPFWKFFYPLLQQTFPALEVVSLDEFYVSINRVAPSFIRTEADEVTYNLHVLLRFEIEVMLCRGELEVEDLPEAWNAKMKRYLGVVPDSYSRGVMQDIHWPSGSIGYFPTYTLGNLYAAQFFRRLAQDIGDVEQLIEKGDFTQILTWLRQKIHSQGTRYRPRELLKVVTQEDLNPQRLIQYLSEKYGDIYGWSRK
ncbi:MAG: carboxypeptidase M32 [Desulfomonilaceae bacterium]